VDDHSDLGTGTDARAGPRSPDHRFPGWIWGVYLLLFGASVPWYLPAAEPMRIWFGLPHWVVISLLATVGVALFTALVVHRWWPDENPER
jgi:hypothetical protein